MEQKKTVSRIEPVDPANYFTGSGNYFTGSELFEVPHTYITESEEHSLGLSNIYKAKNTENINIHI